MKEESITLNRGASGKMIFTVTICLSEKKSPFCAILASPRLTVKSNVRCEEPLQGFMTVALTSVCHPTAWLDPNHHPPEWPEGLPICLVLLVKSL